MRRWMLTVEDSHGTWPYNVITNYHPVTWLARERAEGRLDTVVMFAILVPDDLSDDEVFEAASLREALERIEKLEAVVEAADFLRRSGYDGPFLGEPVAELFSALVALDKYKSRS